METMDLKAINNSVITIAKGAGSILLRYWGSIREKDIVTKSLNSLVSKADQESEQYIIRQVSALIPGAVFLAEESSEQIDYSRGYAWIIDPLDGTTNYLHHFPYFAVSIALAYDGDIVAGVVYDPVKDEVFHAVKGQGAYVNRDPIKTSERPELSQSLIATGFPYSDFSFQEKYLKLFTSLMRKTRGIRRPGAASLDLAYTAAGIFDGFFEAGLQPWDVAAASIIVREAGGMVSDFGGGNGFMEKKEIIAANTLIYTSFLEEVKTYFI